MTTRGPYVVNGQLVGTADNARRAIAAEAAAHGVWIGGAALHGPVDRGAGRIALPDGATIMVQEVTR